MSIMQITQTIQIMPPARMSGGRRHLQPMLPGMEAVEEAPVRVSNRQIAEVLSGIADLLETQRGNPYRIQAYRNAARGVLDLLEPAAQILARGEQLPVAGLGRRLRGRIAEMVLTGTMTFQSGLVMQSLPQGVRALMALEHVGPYTAIRLYEELGVDSAEKLWWAAQRQQIRKLPGFGVRSEARLQEAASHLIRGTREEQPLSGVA